ERQSAYCQMIDYSPEVGMSAWGTAAWDSDAAADWFGDMFEATGLAKYVEETLEREPEEDTYEEIRAAAYMLVALGRVSVWRRADGGVEWNVTKGNEKVNLNKDPRGDGGAPRFGGKNKERVCDPKVETKTAAPS